MIVNFTISNFGPIKGSQTLSFEASKSDDLKEYYIIEPIPGLRLLKLAYIYGSNASGKTTILKALDFLRDLVTKPFDKKSSSFDFKPFNFDNHCRKESTFFTLEFVQKGIRYLYKLELNKNAIVSEELRLFFRNVLLYRRDTDLDKQLTSVKLGDKFKDKINKENLHVLVANTLWNNTVLGGFSKTNLEFQELQSIVDWFENSLLRLVKPRTNLLGYISNRLENGSINKLNLVSLLKKADFKISDIIIKTEEQVVDDKFIEFLKKSLPIPDEEIEKIKAKGSIDSSEILFEHNIILNDSELETYQLSYLDESEGTQRYYQLSGLLELMIKQQLILPIDELESSLHPDLLKHFLLTFLVNAKHSQLIATSHYRELLMEKDILRKDAIWFTEKQADGSTDLFSLDDFDSSVIRDTSSIYNAYKIGKLGAVPNLGDYYLNLEDDKE